MSDPHPVEVTGRCVVYVDAETHDLLSNCQTSVGKTLPEMLELLLDKASILAHRNAPGLYAGVVEANTRLPDAPLLSVPIDLTDDRTLFLAWLCEGVESENMTPPRACSALFYALMFVPCEREPEPV